MERERMKLTSSLAPSAQLVLRDVPLVISHFDTANLFALDQQELYELTNH